MMMEGEYDASIFSALHPGDSTGVGQPDSPACPDSHGNSGAAKASSTTALIETDASGNALAVWDQSDGTREYLGEPPSGSPGTDPDRGRGVSRPDLRPTPPTPYRQRPWWSA
jgi:hypothetical protein